MPTNIDNSFDTTLTWSKLVGNIGPAHWTGAGMNGVAQNYGIYAIYQNNVVNYVGRADNLARRLKEHLKEAYVCCNDATIAQLKYYWAVYPGMWLAEVEAILIRTASVTNLLLRNLQNAADITMGYGTIATVRNTGKVPNFIKNPGGGNLAAGFTQPRVFYNALQVK
jgi:hypothetical protein